MYIMIVVCLKISHLKYVKLLEVFMIVSYYTAFNLSTYAGAKN
jgi:hypothetical protein